MSKEAMKLAQGGLVNFQKAKEFALDRYVFAAITEEDCDYTRASALSKSKFAIDVWIKEDYLTDPKSYSTHTCAVFNTETNTFCDVDTGQVVFDGSEACSEYVGDTEISILNEKGEIYQVVKVNAINEREAAEERVVDLFTDIKTPYLTDITAAIQARRTNENHSKPD